MTTLQGRYQLLELLGEGGMGKVYRAQALHLSRPFAVKELVGPDPTASDYADYLQAFRSEAQLLAGLSHPHLPRVVDFFEEGGRHYLVMDYIEGRDLGSLMDEGRRFGLSQVLAWGIQLLEVLEYLHSQVPPVVVRDLKPSNLILTPNQQLVLVDFGIARSLTPGTQTQALVAGLGTPGYAPPEQCSPGHSDPRGDLYSLAATLYHLLCGQAPPDSMRLAAGLASLSGLSPELLPLERVLQKAMAPRLQDRYPDAASMHAALQGFVRELPSGRERPPVAAPSGRPEQQPRPGRFLDVLRHRFAGLGWKQRPIEGFDLALEGPWWSLAPLMLVRLSEQPLDEQGLEQVAGPMLRQARGLAGIRRCLFLVLAASRIPNPVAVEHRACELSSRGLWCQTSLIPLDLSNKKMLSAAVPDHLHQDNDLHDPMLNLGAALGSLE